MHVADIYAWLSSNPDKAQKLYAAIGSSDIVIVVNKVQDAGFESMDDFYGSLGTSNKYPFRRRFYDKLKKSFLAKTVTFLTGPRKCGKTVSLMQLKAEVPNTQYINVKELDTRDLLLEIDNALQNNICANYLIDEFTYLNAPDIVLAKWSTLLSEYNNTNTHIVITGSQCKALSYWSRIYFCGTCGNIYVDFMSYSEWLSYKQLDIGESSYLDYLQNVDTFSDITDPIDYLKGCLYETVVSNSNTIGIILGNDSDDVKSEMLVDIVFASLVCLHDAVSYPTFKKRKLLEDKLGYLYAEKLKDSTRLNDIVASRYNSLKKLPSDSLYRALLILYRCNVITITPMTTSITVIDTLKAMHPDCCTSESYGEWLFKHFNICIRHPAFFVSLIKYILQTDSIHPVILGSIVECHLRGALPWYGTIEYHDPVTDEEVDYVNIGNQLAIEFTISESHTNNFSVLPKGYKHVMLSKSNYYKYIKDAEDEYWERNEPQW